MKTRKAEAIDEAIALAYEGAARTGAGKAGEAIVAEAERQIAILRETAWMYSELAR